MASSTKSQPSRPQSIKELTVIAETFDFDTQVPVRYWIQAAGSCKREARTYELEGSYQQAYVLFFRHVDLILNKIPKHPEFSVAKTSPAYHVAQRGVGDVLQTLESIKPLLTRRYERYIAAVQKQQTERKDTTREPSPLDYDRANNVRRLAPAENPQAVLDLAKKEQRRRARIYHKSQTEITSNGRAYHELRPDERSSLSQRRKDQPYDSGSLRNIRDQLDRTLAYQTERQPPPARDQPRASYNYPTIPKSDSSRPKSLELQHPTPFKPPKESFSSSSPSPPRLPEKYSLPSPAATPDSPQKQSITFPSTASLESGAPLRSVLLPSGLRDSFLRMAASNTAANLETCGVLCGTLISNALYISKLVIPEQTSTSDTCDTTNEGALFDYCDQEDLLVLGWIHTHPTQDCFMSSRDQHTHSGYQVMMAESIAIVCAPRRQPSWGVFRLTDPPGLQCILKCNQPGIFHPHAERNIYTDAKTDRSVSSSQQGHVIEIKGLDFDVVDLRPGY